MIKSSSFAMPKAAFLFCYLLCGNFILSGYTAEQCPKNPLAPTSSISGMVVGTIVSAEKLVDGVVSYFWYLGQNSVNQVLGVTSGLEGYVSGLTIKVQDFMSGLMGGIGGQLQTIYSGSTGTIRIIFDTIIKMENSAQTAVYNQVESFSDKVVSGKLTETLKGFVKSPLQTVSNGLQKVKESCTKAANSVRTEVNKAVNSVKVSGIPSDIKGILEAPFKGVQKFATDTKTVIQDVKNETSSRFSSYTSDFKNGGIIDKVVALSSMPVGATLEVWSFTLKISEVAINSVSASTKDIVQPFLGEILTERLGKIAMLPLDVVEGFYKSTINTCNDIGGIIARVTGGGSVSAQISMVLEHPLTIVENAWNTTKQELTDFSKATLGQQLTDQLSVIVGAPGNALSGLLTAFGMGNLSATFDTLVSKPMEYLQKAWTQTKTAISSSTQVILGKDWTIKISAFLSAPGQEISSIISSITGGGSLSTQLKAVFTSPIQILENGFSTVKNKTQELLTSVTGGGSISTQIKAVFTKPVELTKNLWNTVKESSQGLIASITGGGSLSTIFTKPLETAKNLWEKVKTSTQSLSTTLFSGGFTEAISKLFTSPLSAASDLYKSLSSLMGSFSASISISGGGITGAIGSFVQAPIEILKGTFHGLQNAEKSLMASLKGLYASLPIIGSSASVQIGVKAGGSGKGSSSVVLGGGASGEGKSDNTEKVSAKAQGSAEAKARRRRRRHTLV